MIAYNLEIKPGGLARVRSWQELLSIYGRNGLGHSPYGGFIRVGEFDFIPNMQQYCNKILRIESIHEGITPGTKYFKLYNEEGEIIPYNFSEGMLNFLVG